LKLLTGRAEKLHNSLMQFDVWSNEWRRIALTGPSPECVTCALGNYSTLEAEAGDTAAMLCGRNAVQISPEQPTRINLQGLSERLRPLGEVKTNDYLLRFRTGEYELTVFQDARLIVRGTDDIATARTLYAKYVGT
jgi:molybdopterin-synthase adenylyltransferase